MKSSRYYSRKAEICAELGRWKARDEWREMARKARAIETRKRAAAKRAKNANTPAPVLSSTLREREAANSFPPGARVTFHGLAAQSAAPPI